MIGIYKITNKTNEKSYIGQSIDIKRRWREHLKVKDNSVFHNELQSQPDNFSFEILEECLVEELNDKELYWIKYYDTYNNGYNLTKGGNYNHQQPINYYHTQKDLNKDDIFLLLWKDYTSASKELTPAAMKLFMYLAKNQDGYDFWFSSKDYCQTFGLADSTFRKAKKELLELGYLKEADNNHVYFNTQPVFKETKESLQAKFQELAAILQIKAPQAYEDLKEEVFKRNLKEITNESIYKVQIKELITLTENLLKEQSTTEIANLL